MAEEADAAPRGTAALLGQERAEATLLEAWRSGRMHHAWLIAGPPGIGKATLAYRFARFLLSREPEGGDALFAPPPPRDLALSAEHPVFRKVAADSHLDLLTIERAVDPKTGKAKSAIGVDQVRAVAEFLHLTAGEGGWRIVLVDPVDDLNVNAANALLKLLEEPPRRAMLLLVTHAPGSLLPTIRSRCRRLVLERLGEGIVDRLLTDARPDLDAGQRAALVHLGEGSIGRALELASGGQLDTYRELVGLLARPLDPVSLHAFADRLARPAAERAYAGFVELWGWWLARLARHAARGDAVPEIVPGEGQAAAAVLGRLGLDRLTEVWEKTTGLLDRGAALNLDRKQMILNVFLALAEAQPAAS